MDWANRVGIAQFSCLADWAKGEKGGGTNSLPLLERVQVRQIKLVLLPVCFIAGDESILEQRADAQDGIRLRHGPIGYQRRGLDWAFRHCS